MTIKNKININRIYFQICFILLLSANIAILFDIPIYRQVLGLVIYFFLPGMLILEAFKLKSFKFSKWFVLSVGLSISFLMFVALIIDTLCTIFGFDRPLGVPILVFLYSSIIVLLLLWVYHNNKQLTSFSINTKFNLLFKNKILILYALTIPLISICGTVVMNVYSCNILLIYLPIIILLYVFILISSFNQINPIIFPIAIFSISLALSLIYPIRGTYPIIGSDSYLELHAISSTVASLHWNAESYNDPVVATLSTGLLSPLTQLLLGIKAISVYRFLGPILMSLIPLALFSLNANYFGNKSAFLASILITSQYSFIYNIGSRVQIGWFFLCLSIVIMLDKEINGPTKKIIFLIFLFSLIASYYTYSYLFTFVLIFVNVLLYCINRLMKIPKSSDINFNINIISVTGVFLWWCLITNSHFNTTVNFIEKALSSLVNLAILDSREELAQNAFGVGLTNLAEIINAIIFYATIALILVGVSWYVYCYIFNYISTKNIEKETISPLYLSIILSFLTIWVFSIVIPFISEGFGIDRAYYLGIPILAPTLVIGADTLSKVLFPKIHYLTKKLTIEEWDLGTIFVFIIIIGHLILSLGLIWQAFGVPQSVLINDEGSQYDIWYIHTEEISAGNFLLENGNSYYTIYGDAYSINRFTPLFSKDYSINPSNRFFIDNKSISGYIFLRYQNVKKDEIVPWYVRKIKEDHLSLFNYSQLFNNVNKIYDNAGAEIHFKLHPR